MSGGALWDQVHLRRTQPVRVRDVPDATRRSAVHARTATRLQTKTLADGLEVIACAQERDLHHHARTETRSQVRRAHVNVPQNDR